MASPNLLYHQSSNDQLNASRIITDKDSLSFWAGIIKATEGPELEKHHYYVPARRIDTPKNVLLEKKTLDHLLKVSDNVRFHFKAFQDLGYRIKDHMEKDQSGFCGPWFADVEGPELRLAKLTAIISAGDGEKPSFNMEQLEAIFEPKSDKELIHASRARSKVRYCGWRGGKPITQDTPFPHIFLNLNRMVGYDMSNDDWQTMTISQLRLGILSGADTICHEFTHAMTDIYFPDQPEPQMNAESVCEAGFSFENYVFGGMLVARRDEDGILDQLMVQPWPDYDQWSLYTLCDMILGLSNFSRVALPDQIVYTPMNFRWECFLEQDFWNEDEPGTTRSESFGFELTKYTISTLPWKRMKLPSPTRVTSVCASAMPKWNTSSSLRNVQKERGDRGEKSSVGPLL